MLHRIADRDALAAELGTLDGVKVLESSCAVHPLRGAGRPRAGRDGGPLPGVRRLDVYEPPSLLVARARSLVGVDGLPWTGEGEVVAVFDSGIDRDHADFNGRVTSRRAPRGGSKEDHVGHGTHVAGIVAGTGAASAGRSGASPRGQARGRGLRRRRRRPLIPADWSELLKRGVAKRGAHIVNLSVGTNSPATTTSAASRSTSSRARTPTCWW